MRVTGLDGREHVWSLAANERDPDRPCSSLHERARRLLATLWPLDRVLEEVALPGCGTPLFLDFFLPLRRLAVEVQGEQHYRQVAFFQGTDPLSFLRAQHRDRRKALFCEQNGLRLVALPFDEDDDAWLGRLRG